MQGGRIEIFGNTGDYVGSCDPDIRYLAFSWATATCDFEPGTARAKPADAFSGMSGGEIIIHGNAGSNVGDKMTGGIIRIEGEFASLGKLLGGTIYHKGNIIFSDGKA
jgi:formylmethanofuran dehydrogenase subunit C